MPDYTERRTPALYRSTTAPSTPALGYTAGDIPPELSPLDELAIRGRMLRKQLGNDGSLGLNPQSVHRSLRQPGRSPGPGGPGPGPGPAPFLERSYSVDSPQHIGGRVGGMGMGVLFTSPSESDRPVSSYPRFSTAASIVSFRDSNASAITITPESIKSPDAENPPNLYGFDFGQSKESDHDNEPEATSPTDRRGDFFRSYGNDEVPPPPVRHDSGLELPDSECETIQDSPGGLRTNATLSTPRDTPRSPQTSNGAYQAYNPNLHAPLRQHSRDETGGLRAPIPPPRKDSKDSSRGWSPLPSPLPHPLRTGSGHSNDSRNDVSNSILPMLDSLRASSPENMDDDDLPNPSFPPSNAPSPKIGQDNHDWLHDVQNPSAPTTPRPPSAGSQRSFSTVGGTKVGNKAINFSRPMLAARPSVDITAANDYLRSPQSNDHTPLQTPIGRSETPIGTAETNDDGIPSYTYTKFYLPRGRALDRNSLVILDDQLPYSVTPQVQQPNHQPPPPQPQPQPQQQQ